MLTILSREEEEVNGLCRVCDQCNQLYVVSAMDDGKCSPVCCVTVG